MPTCPSTTRSSSKSSSAPHSSSPPCSSPSTGSPAAMDSQLSNATSKSITQCPDTAMTLLPICKPTAIGKDPKSTTRYAANSTASPCQWTPSVRRSSVPGTSISHLLPRQTSTPRTKNPPCVTSTPRSIPIPPLPPSSRTVPI